MLKRKRHSKLLSKAVSANRRRRMLANTKKKFWLAIARSYSCRTDTFEKQTSTASRCLPNIPLSFFVVLLSLIDR